jgi:hypothetical protein
MKKLAYQILSTSFLLIVFFSACKKDKDNDGEEQLTQGTWKVIKYEEKAGSAPYEETTSDYELCELDNIWKFTTDGNYEVTEGVSKCNISDPDVYQAGTWSLNSSNTVLTFDGFPFTVETLNSTTLIVSIEIISGFKSRVTYSHL